MAHLVRLAAVLAFLAGQRALAAPEVTVRGHVSLRLVSLQPQEDGTLLEGELRDQDLHTGIPLRVVTVRAVQGERGVTRLARTDRLGRFQVLLPHQAGTGSLSLSLRFEGDQAYAPQLLPPRSVDINKSSLELYLYLEPELDASRADQVLTLSTRAFGRPAGVPLTLRTGSGVFLVRVQTPAASGRLEVKIPTRKLGQPGPLALVALFAGDERLNSTSQRQEATLISPVRVTLQASAREVPADGTIELSGLVRDMFGPVAAGTISILAMGRQAAGTRSGQDGTFSVAIPAAEHPPGSLDLQARFFPAVTWRRAASSPAVEVDILTPRPIPARFYLIAAACTLGVLALLVLIRFRSRLAPLLRLRRSSAPAAPDEAPGPVRSGVRLSRPGLRSIVTWSRDVTGMVADATDTLLLPGAEVEIIEEPGERAAVARAVTDGAGRFVLRDLPEGAFAVRVALAGHVSERFRIQIPHRGSLHGIRVDLLQVRVALLQVFREATAGLLPEKGLWGCWTPRELALRLRRLAGRRHLPMERLTALLEQAYWAPALAKEQLLPLARDLGVAVLEQIEQSGQSGQLPPPPGAGQVS